jgi:hypothetical protein
MIFIGNIFAGQGLTKTARNPINLWIIRGNTASIYRLNRRIFFSKRDRTGQFFHEWSAQLAGTTSSIGYGMIIDVQQRR